MTTPKDNRKHWARDLKVTLWTLIIPPTIWAVHFLFCYLWVAVTCAKSPTPATALDGFPLATLIATVVALLGIVATLSSLFAGLAGPWVSGMDPELHVYPAIVWTLAIWTTAHSGIGAICQLYTLARSIAGRMTPRHDADVRNITVYHHFLALTGIVTFCTIGLFPGVA